MIATPAQLQALETYFSITTLPDEIHLNSAIHITNLPAYVKQVINNLKRSNISETTLRPRYEDLLQIKALLENPPTQ